ncbi:MAG: Glu-tRNA(Gln) amidotransferase subunit GatE [Marinifilaceae bacterium]|jgi:glutamyl-tRNA(Gln) amidotransferase subunit E|nr:Glu-tRNA(Gln) amidotransferase subunit GatE [Marinifilaceae bacterium]
MKKINPKQNYINSQNEIGYINIKNATEKDYQRIGFLSGLEVHQQLKTKEKLFCHCPCGVYHKNEDYNAEVIRHMRPAMSELGGYDGTALMEFKTKKNITYYLNNKTACTYEIDDTPPFKINPEALKTALKISLLCKLNIVGEVHITRKQYLDGSIPTGFQRTAILGVNGHIQLKKKKVNIIQLSIEEDSCREISDIGHERIYKTDRLGMPLIETVTAPELYTPDELQEAAQYIRYLNRSTGLVRTGIGCGREDVNVSCKGGSRVEIKGVAHNKWIPDLSHNEAFRQWALLNIRKKLRNTCKKEDWHLNYKFLESNQFQPYLADIPTDRNIEICLINLPYFKNILSHFTQEGQSFVDELSQRIKVIACLEQPNIISSEDLDLGLDFARLKDILTTNDEDAQILIWGEKEDLHTAIETVEERCLMAFDGVPNETRKAINQKNTIFERVLPGADRMYPDTDSAPISLSDEYLKELQKEFPTEISAVFDNFLKWNIPTDCYEFLLSKNMYPIIREIQIKTDFSPKFIGTFIAHRYKNMIGKFNVHNDFRINLIIDLFEYLHTNNIHPNIAEEILEVIIENPSIDFESVLSIIKFKKRKIDELLAPIEFLIEKFGIDRIETDREKAMNWLMGQLHHQALGNVSLSDLSQKIYSKLKEYQLIENH